MALAYHGKILHDTAIAVASHDKVAYAHAQYQDGSLAQSKSTDTAHFTCSAPIPVTSWNSIKLFSPLAAVLFDKGKIRYVFYLDRTNTINNLVREKEQWRVGDLGHRGVVAAEYSKLAAVTVTNSGTTPDEAIHIFYQSTDKTGAIREIRGYDGHWQPITYNYGDHPLLGTSLAAVAPLSCIKITETLDPVVFFQKDNLRLAKLQGLATSELKEIEETEKIDPRPSPHTPLAAITNSDSAFIFYKSNDNIIRRITIDSAGKQSNPVETVTTTPKGNIAALTCKKMTMKGQEEKYLKFYQPPPWNTVTIDGSTDVFNMGW